MTRLSVMDDPELREKLAELYASGASRAEMAEAFQVTKETITRWTGRPDVQALITSKTKQRVNRILRRVDAAIEGRLENDDAIGQMDMKELLAVRREFVPKQVEIGGSGSFNDNAAEFAAWATLDAGAGVPALDAGPEDFEEIDDVDEEEYDR